MLGTLAYMLYIVCSYLESNSVLLKKNLNAAKPSEQLVANDDTLLLCRQQRQEPTKISMECEIADETSMPPLK